VIAPAGSSNPVRRSQALRALTAATLFWALSFPVMKTLLLVQEQRLPGTGSWFLTSLSVAARFGCAGLLLLLFTGRRLGSLTRREVEQGLVLAGFGGLGILFQMDGLAYTAASTSAFLTQAYCVFIPVWVMLVGHRLPPVKQCICIVLVVGGVWILAGLNLQTMHVGRGELETLIGSLLFTGQILTLEGARYTGNRPVMISTIMFPAMALLCLPVVWATAPSAAACLHVFAAPAPVGLLAVLVLFCTLISYLAMNYWQPSVTSTEAGLIYCLEPVLASLLALFFPFWLSRWAGVDYPNEQLTFRLVAGGGLITIANILLQSSWLEPAAGKARI
jgi:drug/metabolite transporter (DMT)-like permease